MTNPRTSVLAVELRSLVSQSTALLGNVIRRECGDQGFERIEAIRRRMAGLRERGEEDAFDELTLLTEELRRLPRDERLGVATAFSLMLELMNSCENAYRSHRLESRVTPPAPTKGPEAVIYVFTAHPTEARSPENIAVFHRIQELLIGVLRGTMAGEAVHFGEDSASDLVHLLEVAWRTPIVRNRAPTVKDEAEHIYSLILREDVLSALLERGRDQAPFFMRSWVGGDKDGHPGVDEKVLLTSLTLSRHRLLRMCLSRCREIRETLRLFPSERLQKRLALLERRLRVLGALSSGDGGRVAALKNAFASFSEEYIETVGAANPQLRSLGRLLQVFPALVVPLELRESSDVLMAKVPAKGSRPAIERMLAAIARVSRGGDPRWYIRGFIVSMTESAAHLRAAALLERSAFGDVPLPVIPLFERAESLAGAKEIVEGMLRDPILSTAIQDRWDGTIEMMVGYSDSSKQVGVLPSRLAIARALPILENVCREAGFRPSFFHGSGGSVDRGGGSIEDQTAWWPRSALRYYKVTVQGEMVERAMATPAIALGQVERIADSARRGLESPARFHEIPALSIFANKIAKAYSDRIHSPRFLELVEKATPYSYLDVLKIGSRPVKRAKELSVEGLRAIPWILCWTQTRVLFPTWWGVGTAWSATPPADREALRRAFVNEPVFTSYMKALGFTLAKVELPVWRLCLENSGLSEEQAREAFAMFEDELRGTRDFLRGVTGQDDVLWFRPWLAESIRLRSPMIHPLNVLQLLARLDRDDRLLRLTVTGISSGMLTTG